MSPLAMFSIVSGSRIIPCLTPLSPLSETDLSLGGSAPKITGLSVSGETDFAWITGNKQQSNINVERNRSQHKYSVQQN